MGVHRMWKAGGVLPGPSRGCRNLKILFSTESYEIWLNWATSCVNFRLRKSRRFFRMVDSVREQLFASHEEFRRLAQEHTQLSQRLNSLIEKRYLTEDEKLEEVRLKKLKLRIKDQMQMIEQDHKRTQSQVA